MPFFFFVNYSPEDCFSFLVCSFLFFSFLSVCICGMGSPRSMGKREWDKKERIVYILAGIDLGFLWIGDIFMYLVPK